MLTIAHRFLHSSAIHPNRIAVSVGSDEASYAQLAELAQSMAATLSYSAVPRPANSSPQRCVTAVFGHRHIETFAGILAASLRGDGYVPLNPIFPMERTRVMLERSGATELIVDRGAIALLPELLRGVSRDFVVLLPFGEVPPELDSRHRVLVRNDFRAASDWRSTEVDAGALAYILFTSGSTGIPKGVMVSQANVHAFLDAMMERYQPTPDDRFSQTFDLTFDLSVFDMFMAWSAGARVVCPTAQEKLFPGKYIKDRAISFWFSVPSTAVLMSRLRMLKEDAYPALRWALFCGEALPVDVIEAWRRAAAGANCENLYGPTELTIACTLYRWTQSSPSECENGIVPIGYAYPNMQVRIEKEDGTEASYGEAGELLMTGPQLSLGYLNDPEKTAKAFVQPRGESRVFYRTGDRVVQRRAGAPLLYLGRVDNQIKIQGYRVELGEIEAVLRKVSGAEVAIAVGYPKTAAGADGIVAFVGLAENGEEHAERVRTSACAELAPYMQPTRVIFVHDWPLNSNGKVDRGALLASLESVDKSAK